MQETQETWIWSLGGEDSLEEGMATTPVFCLENPTDRGAWQVTVHRVTKSQTWWSNLACTQLTYALVCMVWFSFSFLLSSLHYPPLPVFCCSAFSLPPCHSFLFSFVLPFSFVLSVSSCSSLLPFNLRIYSFIYSEFESLLWATHSATQYSVTAENMTGRIAGMAGEITSLQFPGH